MTLPADFLARPFAHRGLHGADAVENSRTAFDAAVAAGYGIELDVQIAGDGVPVVFHDPTLGRLTDGTGAVRRHSSAALGDLRLLGSGDVIEPLARVLTRIGDRVPVLVEIKDQGGDPGPEQAVGQVVADAARGGARIAVMSFRPDYIHALDWLPAGVPLGLTTEGRGPVDGWRDTMAFVSHDHADLDAPAIADLRGRGASILCWTIKSAAQAQAALRHADQITFEGFRPA